MVILRPITPPQESQDHEQCHHPTPKKTQVRILTKFAQQKRLAIGQKEIFDYCDIKHRTGWRMLEPNTDIRRHHNSPYTKERRGRKCILGDNEFKKIENFIIEGGFPARVCGWVEIVRYILPDIKIAEHAIRRAFNRRGYYKCVACQKAWLSPQSLLERRQYLQIRGEWSLSQWHRVRFSDECHFGIGPKRKLKVIRRQGERYHPDCIQKNQDKRKAKQKNEKRWHVWAAIGYNFKSDLVFYETSSSNGKMTQEVYMRDILNGPIKEWIARGNDFLLEEDKDSGHGVGETGGSIYVRRLKESIGLNYFFNASGSPDLSPIENIWRAQKQQINDFDHFDDESLIKAIKRSWNGITMKTINKYVDSMVDRMQSLHNRDGHVTEY